MSDNLQRRWVTSSFDSPDEIEGSFFVRAQIEVSEQGRVKHLLLNRPLKMESGIKKWFVPYMYCNLKLVRASRAGLKYEVDPQRRFHEPFVIFADYVTPCVSFGGDWFVGIVRTSAFIISTIKGA